MQLFNFANELAEEYSADNLPPIDKWHPDYCGSLDIRIDTDGTWHYLKSPITRAKIVRLFSTLLKLEEDGIYYLVTPVEKISINVDDVPFVIVDWQYVEATQTYILYTLTGDKIILDANTQLELGKTKLTKFSNVPYVRVRKNLYGRLNRNVFYQLLDRAEEIVTDKGTALCINSNNTPQILGLIN